MAADLERISIGDIRKEAENLDNLRGEFQSLLGRSLREIKTTETIASGVSRLVDATSDKVQRLVREADRVNSELHDAERRARLDGKTDTRETREVRKLRTSVENEASQLFGKRVNIDEIHAYAVTTRPLTVTEQRAMKSLAGRAKDNASTLSGLERDLARLLVRAQRVSTALAGLSRARLPSDAEDALKSAQRSVQMFLSDMASTAYELQSSRRQMEGVSKAADRVDSASQVGGIISDVSNVALVVGGVMVVAGAATSPVTGILVSLGLLGRAIAAAIAAFKRRGKDD